MCVWPLLVQHCPLEPLALRALYQLCRPAVGNADYIAKVERHSIVSIIARAHTQGEYYRLVSRWQELKKNTTLIVKYDL